MAFIAARDSFDMATVWSTGWRYCSTRRPARLHPRVRRQDLAIADFRGNTQYISVGNLKAGNRVALIMVDYPARRRLKIYAHVEIKSLDDDPALAAAVTTPGYGAKPERVMLFHLDTFDWNCAQHITPRFTEAEIAAALAPVRARMMELEAENKALRDKLAEREATVL